MPLVKVEKPSVMAVASSDRLDDLSAQIEKEWEACLDYRGNWDEVHADNWRMMRAKPAVRRQTFPWPNAANYVIPVAQTNAMILNSLLYNVMFETAPEWVGDDIDDRLAAEIVNKYFWNVLFSEDIPLVHLGSEHNQDTIVDGTSAFKLWHERRSTATRVTSVEPIVKTTRQEPLFDGDLERASTEITGEKIGERAVVGQTQSFRVESVDLSYIYPAPGSKASLQDGKCDYYFEEELVSWPEIRKRARVLGWKNVGEEGDELHSKLVEREPTPKEELAEESEETGRKTFESVRVLYRYGPLVLPGEFELADGTRHLQRLGDDNGYPEEAIVVYLKDTKKVADIVPLSRERAPMRQGHPPRRPHISNRFVRFPNHFYGMGLMDSLRGMQKLVSTLFNQLIDSGTIRNIPFFLFNPAQTGLMPDMMSLRPGQGIPVKDPRGVVFPRWQGDLGYYQSVFANAQAWTERIASVTDYAAGRNPSIPNAQRTARGMFQLLQQNNQQFAYRVGVMAEAWKTMFIEMFLLHRKNLVDPVRRSYLDEDRGVMETVLVPPQVFSRDFQLKINMNPDKVLRQQSVQNFMSLMLQVPSLTETLLIQNPQGFRGLFREAARSFDMQEEFDDIWPVEMPLVIQQQLMQQQSGQSQPPSQQPSGFSPQVIEGGGNAGFQAGPQPQTGGIG